MAEHKASYVAPIVLVCLTMVTMFAFNGLSATEIGGIFINNTGQVSDTWFSNITPSGPTFSIWGLIYTWQVLFLVYALSTLCRQGLHGYLYYSPGLIPPAVFLIYAFNNALNITWLFMWDRSVENVNYLIGGLVILALCPFTLYWCIGLTCYTTDKYASTLITNGLEKEIWFMYFIVQNAFGIYATWTTIATILNLGAVLTYVVGVEMETTSLVQLGILSVEILAWFLTDIIALDRYTRYLFTPHLVLVWAFTGSFVQNYSDGEGETHATWIAVLLGVACFALFTKIIVIIVKSIKSPLHQNAVVLSTLEDGKINPAYEKEKL